MFPANECLSLQPSDGTEKKVYIFHQHISQFQCLSSRPGAPAGLSHVFNTSGVVPGFPGRGIRQRPLADELVLCKCPSSEQVLYSKRQLSGLLLADILTAICSHVSTMTMLPLPLLLAVLLLLPPESCSAQQVSFSSHLQLDLQEPPGQDQPWFKPSATCPLPPNVAEVKTKPTTVYRPRSLDAFHRARLLSLRHAQSEVDPVEWDTLEVEGPDIGNLNTLIQLARMSANAYALPGQKNWYEVDAAWNKVSSQVRSLRIIPHLCCPPRAFRLDGRNRTAFAGMYSYPRTIRLSFYLSRARLSKGLPPNSTSSTITCTQLRR